MADYDVIVVGAGLGGLSTGALAAKEGFKTLILEQSDIIGGCCSTFEVDGYKFAAPPSSRSSSRSRGCSRCSAAR